MTFQFQYSSYSSVTHTGAFVTKDKMSGTWVYDQDVSENGSWEAVRVVTTAQNPVPQASAKLPGKNQAE